MSKKTCQYKNNTIIIFSDYDLFIKESAKNWIELCNICIKEKGHFFVALSGGTTPQKIYQEIVYQKNMLIDTSKIFLFWSDERCVAPTDSQSNYFNSISLFSQLNIPKKNIFPMPAEHALEIEANSYENTIKSMLPNSSFDLIMLGIGEDGHTASLFPRTQALQESHKLVVINDVPQKKTQRMTFTYSCLQKAHNIYIYVSGENKSLIMTELFINKKIDYPIGFVFSHFPKNTWFIDNQAGKNLIEKLNFQ